LALGNPEKKELINDQEAACSGDFAFTGHLCVFPKHRHRQSKKIRWTGKQPGPGFRYSCRWFSDASGIEIPEADSSPSVGISWDLVVDTADVMYLTNYLFMGGLPPCEPQRRIYDLSRQAVTYAKA
jgi:hypothetical protein